MIIDSAITSFCVVLVTNSIYSDACNKAVEVSLKHNGIYQLVSKYENSLISYADQKGNYYLGKDGMSVVGITGFAYKTYKNKSLNFKLPTLGICDSVNNTITPTAYTINLQWHIQ